MFESEFVERCALEDLHAMADEDDIKEAGLISLKLNSAFVSVATNLPSSAIVINRSLGLGLGSEASEGEIATLVSEYKRNYIDRFFIQVHPAHKPRNVDQWLLNAGLKVGRGWQKFSRGRKLIPTSKCELSIKEIGADRGMEFAEIVCNAFDIGSNAINWLSKIPARPDWHIFMSFNRDEPAGVGALYVKDGFGWTDFAATAPEHRRRGSQGALMQARLERALDLGCTRIFSCTGVSTPGDPQHSYSNIIKSGFVEEYVRDNYEPN
jgi:GNAT superfamily N-acetyltransferase